MYDINRVPLKRRPIIAVSDEAPTDNFLGLGKRARARKDERVAIRNEKKRAKIADRSYKKHVKADALAKRYSGKAEAGIIAAQGEAAANMTLAQQGVVGNPIQQPADIGQQALGIAGGFLGTKAGNGDSYGPPEQPQYIDEEDLSGSSLGKMAGTTDDAGQTAGKKNNTMMYLLIAGVAVAGFMFMKKK